MSGYRSLGIERAQAAMARAAANPVVAEARRVVASGKRSFSAPAGMATPYEASSQNGLVPVVPDLGPLDSVGYLRGLQRISRHCVRNSTWFQGIVRVVKDTYCGIGPEPVSRHTALVDSFLASCNGWDATGQWPDFGSWLREGQFAPWFTDGETFGRIELDMENFDGSTSPLALTAYSSDYCPLEKNSSGPDADGIVDISGIGFQRRGKKNLPARYWMHRDHPRNLGRLSGGGWEPVAVPAREVTHLAHYGMNGAVRGHVILAAALIRALKVNMAEDSDLRRRITSALASITIERPLDGMADESLFPDEKVIDEMLSAVELVPGGIIELPAGYKASMLTPPDAPGLPEAIRMGILSMCAGIGVPPYEVLGTTGDNERVMRFFAAAMKTRAQIYRGTVEGALLSRVWRRHVDCQLALGLWSPSRPEDLRDAYQVGWVWPVVQSAALTQELGTMMTAAEKGHIPPGYVAQTYLGLRPEIVTRMSAAQRAQQAEVGLIVGGQFWTPATPTAQRIKAHVELEEGRERDLVEQAYSTDPAPGPVDEDI